MSGEEDQRVGCPTVHPRDDITYLPLLRPLGDKEALIFQQKLLEQLIVPQGVREQVCEVNELPLLDLLH